MIEMIKCFIKAMAQSYVSDETASTTKWGTIINPLPKGAVLLEETSDVLQWKRRYQQILADGRIIEYTETDDCLGYTKKSRIVKE